MSKKAAVALSQEAGKMRPHALSGANGRLRACLCGCGNTFIPSRSWHEYYSAACRRRGNNQIKSRKLPADVRATLNRQEAKLDAIIQFLKDGRS